MAKTTDGTILAGGFSVTFVTAAVSAVVNSYSISRPGSTIVQTDANDEPDAAIHYDGLITGTAEIRAVDTASQADFRGDTFVTTAMTGSSQTFIVNTCSPSGSKSGLSTQSISFTLQMN